MEASSRSELDVGEQSTNAFQISCAIQEMKISRSESSIRRSLSRYERVSENRVKNGDPSEKVPATTTTAEVSEYYQPKLQSDWHDQNKEMVSIASKSKRLLIMALPNDIFMCLDHCVTSKELWSELLRELEECVTSLKNNSTMCINEYHEFNAKEGESLKETSSRFNILIKWLHLAMSIRTNLDLEIMCLADLYGSLASLEPQVRQLKCSIGGPLALVAKRAKGKGEKKTTEEKKKKMKKALVIENEDVEDMSSEEELSMRDMMKTLVSITRDYRRGSAGRGKSREYTDRRGDEERRREVDRRRDFDRGIMTEDLLKKKIRDPIRGWMMVGMINRRCGKQSHYAAECRAVGPVVPQKVVSPQRPAQKPKQDAAYFRKKVDYYNKKMLLAQTSELVTVESPREDEPQKGLVAFEELESDVEFCGVANGDSDSASIKSSEVSSCSEMNELYSEIIENLDLHKEEFNNLKEKLTLCEKEMNTLTKERTRFFKMFVKAEEERISL
ncbi:hypothetical protein OSB04_024559 [Centaurea solstitialis]|uniref:Uncharacterized protein n=1 Tax=Centaurea solstitialis TaxID=347529 RepID=A0AA38W0S0_9ASTR|nr:hypothetical protein OSB04_024559 [Centaurea solstitialis]